MIRKQKKIFKPASNTAVHAIVKRYRKKNSVFFLIKWTIIFLPRKQPKGFKFPMIMHKQLWNRDMRKLWGIYRGLKKEIGHHFALMAAAEIVQVSRINIK